MRSIIISCLVAILLASCLNEDRVDPAKPSTFVRYINGGYEDDPVTMDTTSDGGYIILANTLRFPDYSKDSIDVVGGVETIVKFPMDRIKLVKVDQYGTVIWTRILPDDRGPGVIGFKAHGIDVYNEGYIISGEVIKKSKDSQTITSSLMLIQTDADGRNPNAPDDPVVHYEFSLPSAAGKPGEKPSVRGMGVTWVDASQVLVLGSIDGASDNNGPKTMALARINLSASPKKVEWDRSYYGSTSSTLINKLFFDNNNLVFGGTIPQAAENTLTDVRLVSAKPDDQGTNYNDGIGDPELSERANGLCKTSYGYALVGSSNVAGKADRDIFFTRLASVGGSPLGTLTYSVNYESGVDAGGNDEGNSICTTADQGFIILGTIPTTITPDGKESIGRGETDYYLMKIDYFGVVQWTRAFGSKRGDIGIAVLQARDGGYLVLGKTNLANVQTMALIKTNADGDIE